MKILITGGAGFIASHIVDAYIKAGHEVVIIDNLSAGTRKNLNEKAKFYKADICDFDLMEKIFKRERPEAVSHHAALISVADSIKDPLAIYRVNVLGTANVLYTFGETAKKEGKIIFPSSAAVYGDAQRIPTPEDAPLQPLSPYGISKVLGEELVRAMSRHYGLGYAILRYANVYGPRQNKQFGGVIAKIQGLVETGKRPVMYGGGTNTRDYTFVKDVAHANELALTRGARATLNIATGNTTKDKELLRLLFNALHYGRAPLKQPARKGEIKISALNPHLAIRVLGWTPHIKLKNGIEMALATV